MIPESVTYDMALEILMRSTCFISVDFEKMADRISNFPFPEYNLLGLTYFFKGPATSSEQSGMASITLLIRDELSSFINSNIENIKENLSVLCHNLIEQPEVKRQLLLEYYYNLLELLNSYKSIQILTEKRAKSKEATRNCVLLSYFHGKVGPTPIFCYPDILETDMKKQISRELEMNISEGFFTRSYPDFIAVHYYFELPSEIARGRVEMCLISFIFDRLPSKERINSITFSLFQQLDKLKHKEYVAFGFYKEGYSLTDKSELVQQMHSYLQQWVIEVYQKCVEEKT